MARVKYEPLSASSCRVANETKYRGEINVGIAFFWANWILEKKPGY